MAAKACTAKSSAHSTLPHPAALQWNHCLSYPSPSIHFCHLEAKAQGWPGGRRALAILGPRLGREQGDPPNFVYVQVDLVQAKQAGWENPGVSAIHFVPSQFWPHSNL